MLRFAWVLAIAACTSSAPGGGSGGGGDDGGGSGGGGDDGGGGGGGGSTALVECVNQTNMYRATLSLPALTESMALEAFSGSAAEHDYMAGSAHSYFHDTSGGGISFAENECPGFPLSPGDGVWNLSLAGGDIVSLVDQCVQAFYDEGPGSDYSTHGHYINMMNPSYTTLGCGIYTDESNGNTTITQDYGN